MAKQGKSLDPDIELIIQKEFLNSPTFPDTSAPTLVSALKRNYPKLDAQGAFPTTVTINKKIIKPIKDYINKEGDKTKDSPWSLINWKNNQTRSQIRPESIKLILRVQKFLSNVPHWNQLVQITNRDAEWISTLQEIGFADDKSFENTDELLGNLWLYAKEYSTIERLATVMGWDNESVIEDLCLLALSEPKHTGFKLLNEIQFSHELGLRPRPSANVSTILNKLLGEASSNENFELEDEIEFPEVTFGMKNVYYRFLDTAKVFTDEYEDEGVSIQSSISSGDQDKLYPWLRKDYLILLEDLESIIYDPEFDLPYMSEQPAYTIGDILMYWPVISKDCVEIAIAQIPPRDKSGNPKIVNYDESSVEKAKKHLAWVSALMEKLIQTPKIRERLEIETIEKTSSVFREDMVYCKKNFDTYGPYGP